MDKKYKRADQLLSVKFADEAIAKLKIKLETADDSEVAEIEDRIKFETAVRNYHLDKFNNWGPHNDILG